MEEWMWDAGKGVAIILFWLYSTYASDKRRENAEQKHREKSAAGLSPSLERDALVNARLAQLLALLDADKAKIFRFHNGGIYYNGQSIKKFSLTHIHVKTGVAAPRMTDLKDLPSSLFPHLLTELVKTKDAAISWYADEAPDDFLKSLALQEGTRFTKSVALRDVSGNMLGFLEIDWITQQTKDNPHRKEVMIKFAREIGNLLSLNSDI